MFIVDAAIVVFAIGCIIRWFHDAEIGNDPQRWRERGW